MMKLAAASCLLLLLASCQQASREDYVATVRHGLTVIPASTQIESLIGPADHFITHYGFGKQPLTWNTEVFFKGGYCLTMQVDVTVDYSKNQVVAVNSTPKFYLKEFKEIEVRSGGQMAGTFKRQREFDVTEWNQIVAAGGDFAAIGFPIEDATVKHFDQWAADVRAARIDVRKPSP